MAREKLHKPRVEKEKDKWDREFLGQIDGFGKGKDIDREQRNREKKHLKAYLRGNSTFISGYKSEMVGTTRVTTPIYSKVKQKLTKIEN